MASDAPPNNGSTAQICLPERLDFASCGDLYHELIQARGQALELSCAGVAHVGAPGLQLLVSAERQWQQDDLMCSFKDVSPAMRQGLHRLGYASFPFQETQDA